MPVIDNYKLLPVVKISVEGDWRVQRMMARNKISGVVKWFTKCELEAMGSNEYVMPPSPTMCVNCDTELRADGTCRHGCPRRVT